jgi:hypothetical protein
MGPGGAPGIGARLDYLRDSFGPTIDLNGTASVPALLKTRRTLDTNINWNRGADPIENTARNATRQIRGKVNDLLYDAEPSLKAPSQRYGNLADAEELARNHEGTQDVRLNSLPRSMTDLLVGGGTGYLTHDPRAALGAAIASHAVPMIWKQPLVQTGFATGAFQAGRGLRAIAPAVEALSPSLSSGIDPGRILSTLSMQLAQPRSQRLMAAPQVLSPIRRAPAR